MINKEAIIGIIGLTILGVAGMHYGINSGFETAIIASVGGIVGYTATNTPSKK